MNAPPSTLRLTASAVPAALALGAGVHGLPRLIGHESYDPAMGFGVATVLLLAWLLAPAPWGGGASLAGLLAPDPARRLWRGIAVALPGAALLGMLAAYLLAFGDALDLDAAPRHQASSGDVLRGFALALGVTGFHGLYTLGWALGSQLPAGRGERGCVAAFALTAAYLTLGFTMVGLPLFGLGAAVFFFGPLTLLMAIPVLLGGRVWPVILASAAVATLPMLALGVRDYP